MKYGARNQLTGKVTNIKRGNLMSRVNFDIPANSPMSSVMTIDSLDNLGADTRFDPVHRSSNTLLAKKRAFILPSAALAAAK
jgi:molybdopterin-binding protein